MYRRTATFRYGPGQAVHVTGDPDVHLIVTHIAKWHELGRQELWYACAPVGHRRMEAPREVHEADLTAVERQP